MYKILNYNEFINENILGQKLGQHVQVKKELEKEFINHHINGTDIKKELVENLLNILPDGAEDITEIYRGVRKGRDISVNKCWTMDGETADAFAREDGFVITMDINEFREKYDFVSMDVIDEYLEHSYKDYLSESEIFAYEKNKLPIGKITESIVIDNPLVDGYNEIMVDGKKVGYIILSPARKEYYWVDVNLSMPLAIVDIKIYKEYRGNKYMKEVMNWLYNFAKEKSYKSLFLRVDDDSEISQDILLQIYQKFGFSIYRTYGNDDDIFMYKIIN